MRRQPRYGDRASGLPDRRASRRFPLRLAIKYRKLGAAGTSDWCVSESVNISSGGVFFCTQEAFPPGQSLEACFAWPVLLDKHIPLRLVAKGPVVRNDGTGTAMRFETYEFRTTHVHVEAHNVVAARHAEGHVNGETGLKIAG
jgi:hypothetical protein